MRLPPSMVLRLMRLPGNDESSYCVREKGRQAQSNNRRPGSERVPQEECDSRSIGRSVRGRLGTYGRDNVPFPRFFFSSVGLRLAAVQGSRKIPTVALAGGRARVFVCLKAGRENRIECWLQRDSCTCNADGEYLWIPDLQDMCSAHRGRWELAATPSTVHKFCGELQGTGIQCNGDGRDGGDLQLEVFQRCPGRSLWVGRPGASHPTGQRARPGRGACAGVCWPVLHCRLTTCIID